MKRNLLLFALLCSPNLQALEVLSSIKPLQLLVAEISEGIHSSELLIPAQGSPHDFHLRPSERNRMEQADLIFWIGPQLEMALSKPLGQLPTSTQVVALAGGDNLSTPPSARPSATHSNHHSSHEAHHDDHHPTHHEEQHKERHARSEHAQEHEHEHEHDSQTHPWLDPENAAEMAKQISTTLSQQDPANADLYQRNLKRFLGQLEQLELQLLQQLEPIKTQGYFVFHDAYQGFEQHFGLNHLGAFSLSPERKPGAKRLTRIRQQLQTHQAQCVFSEPQFSSKLLDNLTAGTQVRHGQLDPLGSTIAPTTGGFIQLLRDLGQSFHQCLSVAKT